MPDILDYLVPVAVAKQVADTTGKTADAVSAGGWAAFINSVTGEPPTILPLPNRRAKLLLNKNQVLKMQKWLDQQAGLAVGKPKDQSLEIDLNPVLVPWSLKYLIPVAVFFVLAGWFGHYYLTR